MGVSKTNLFSTEQNELASIAKALAHPARLAIIQHLLSTDSCINSDLVNELGLAQATISQHLKELKNIGIIQGTIEGVSVCYCINPEKWSYISTLFEQLFQGYKKSNSNTCC